MDKAQVVKDAVERAVSTQNRSDVVPWGLGDRAWLHVGADADGWWRVFAGSNETPPAEKFNAVRRDVFDAALSHAVDAAFEAGRKAEAADFTDALASALLVDLDDKRTREERSDPETGSVWESLVATVISNREDWEKGIERTDEAEFCAKEAEGRIYLLRDTLYLIEGDCSASSERAKLGRERDEALRDGTWVAPEEVG